MVMIQYLYEEKVLSAIVKSFTSVLTQFKVCLVFKYKQISEIQFLFCSWFLVFQDSISL